MINDFISFEIENSGLILWSEKTEQNEMGDGNAHKDHTQNIPHQM